MDSHHLTRKYCGIRVTFCSREGERDVFLIDNPWTKCTVRQRLMGWSRKKKAEWGERAIENDKSNPSCLPRREVSGTIADMKSAWTSSRSAECYLWQQQEITHSSSGESLHEATGELTEGKEFREFRWLQPTPLITLVLSNTISALAVCGNVKLAVLVCECLCAHHRGSITNSVQV